MDLGGADRRRCRKGNRRHRAPGIGRYRCPFAGVRKLNSVYPRIGWKLERERAVHLMGLRIQREAETHQVVTHRGPRGGLERCTHSGGRPARTARSGAWPAHVCREPSKLPCAMFRKDRRYGKS